MYVTCRTHVYPPTFFLQLWRTELLQFIQIGRDTTVFTASANSTIKDFKGSVKGVLEKSMRLIDDLFHPASKDIGNDVLIMVLAPIPDDSILATLCPNQNDYVPAVVPSAPTQTSPGSHVSTHTILFDIKPYLDYSVTTIRQDSKED